MHTQTAPLARRLREKLNRLHRRTTALPPAAPSQAVTAAASQSAAPAATPAADWLEFDLVAADEAPPDCTAQRSRRWEHADFGSPSLEPPARPQWLHQVDELARTGYHGAALAVFEHALHDMPTKPAWLLLRLLDLYAALDQGANHDRVAAELEALYSIQIPALHADGTDDPALEQHADLTTQVCGLWREPGAAARLLEGWLLAAPGQARLGLACFRDLLMLHGLARELAASETPQAMAA